MLESSSSGVGLTAVLRLLVCRSSRAPLWFGTCSTSQKPRDSAVCSVWFKVLTITSCALLSQFLSNALCTTGFIFLLQEVIHPVLSHCSAPKAFYKLIGNWLFLAFWDLYAKLTIDRLAGRYLEGYISVSLRTVPIWFWKCKPEVKELKEKMTFIPLAYNI